MGRRVLACAAVAAAVCLGLVWSTNGQGARPPSPVGFDGKYVSAYLRSDKDSSYALENCQIRQIGDQSFLVGVGVNTGSGANWCVGETIWVAMNDVSCLHEYPTLDRMKAAFAKVQKYYEEAEKAKAASAPWVVPAGVVPPGTIPPAPPPPAGPGF